MQHINMRQARRAHRAVSWIPASELVDEETGRVYARKPGTHRTRFRAWLRATFAAPSSAVILDGKAAGILLSGGR